MAIKAKSPLISYEPCVDIATARNVIHSVGVENPLSPPEMAPVRGEASAAPSSLPSPPTDPPTPKYKTIRNLKKTVSPMTLYCVRRGILDKYQNLICAFDVHTSFDGAEHTMTRSVDLFAPENFKNPKSELVAVARISNHISTATITEIGEVVKIYTYEPNFVGQSPCHKSKGLDGSPIYLFGALTQSFSGANFAYTRYVSDYNHYHSGGVLAPKPSLVAYAPAIRNAICLTLPCCLIPLRFARFRLELYPITVTTTNTATHHLPASSKASSMASSSLSSSSKNPQIVINDKNATIEVAAGTDLLESICIHVAFELCMSTI